MTRYRAFVSVAVGIALAVACSSESTRSLSTDGGVPGDATVGDDDDQDASTVSDATVEPREDATGSGGRDGSGGAEGLGGYEGLGGFPGLGGMFGLGGVLGMGGLVIDIDGGPPPVDGGPPLPDATPGAGGSGGIIEPPVTGANAFMAEYFTSYCEASARCCADQGDPVTAEGCIEQLLPAILEEFGDLDANPNVFLQPDYADSCLAAMDALGCDEPLPDDCARALMGTQLPGGPCTVDFECIPAGDGVVYCEIDPWDPSLGQVCVAYSGDQTGQPCAETCAHLGSSIECISTGGELGKCITNLGFFCDESSWTCQPSRAEGESCSFTEQCQLGRDCALGTCIAQFQAGEPCDPELGQALGCVRETYCSPAGVCVPAGMTGAGCGGDEECVSEYCNSYGTCESPTLLACETMSLL